MFSTVYYLYRRRRLADVVTSVERIEEVVLLLVARVFGGVRKENDGF